jgi:D-glycero-D-manno-heptose 1,7-bisphosphate phosphatase
MYKCLMAVGGRIDAVFFCPHTPTDGCSCRKPQPGLMHDIGKRYGIDLKQVPMVADTLRDLQAAAAAGCEPHLVLTGRASDLGPDEVQHWVAQVPGTQVHDDLPAFAEHLLARSATPS